MNTTTKTQVRVNDQEIENIFIELENQVPSPFISLTLCTDFTSMVKKSKIDGSINPYYKELKKTQTKTYRLVTDYEKRVHNNLIKEGKNPNDFVVESPKGKEHISKSVLRDTETRMKRYVMVEWFMEVKGSEPTYNHNGNEIDKRMFEKWITDYSSSNEKQGLDREVKPITPMFQSIVSFRVNGTEYIREVE